MFQKMYLVWSHALQYLKYMVVALSLWSFGLRNLILIIIIYVGMRPKFSNVENHVNRPCLVV